MERSREERMRDDFANYLHFGGRHDFETWAERYSDDYPIELEHQDDD